MGVVLLLALHQLTIHYLPITYNNKTLKRFKMLLKILKQIKLIMQCLLNLTLTQI